MSRERTGYIFWVMLVIFTAVFAMSVTNQAGAQQRKPFRLATSAVRHRHSEDGCKDY